MVELSLDQEGGGNPARLDFAIVGAPKCGTTALYTYLATHPDICMSSRKEPYFWCPDVPIAAPVVDMADYAELWRDAAPGMLCGEATPAYLRSQLAVPAILRANPRAKFIVLLRSPAEMAASFHAQMLVSLQEEVADFERAWNLQERRAAGQGVPRACYHPPNLQYAAVCALGDQLERVMAVVPSEQLHVVMQHDLADDPRRAYLDVLAFLGVSDDGRADFAPINRNRRRRGLGFVRRYRRTIARRPLLGALAHRARLTRMIERASLFEEPRAPLDPVFAAKLHAFFLPQVEKIEALLGRDLTAWKSGASA